MAGADDEVHAHAVCHAGSWAGNDFLGFDDSLTRAASFLTCVVSSGVEPPKAANAWIWAILAAATVSGALFMPAPLARKRSIMDAMINVYAGRATARGCETWGVNSVELTCRRIQYTILICLLNWFGCKIYLPQLAKMYEGLHRIMQSSRNTLEVCLREGGIDGRHRCLIIVTNLVHSKWMHTRWVGQLNISRTKHSLKPCE